MSNSEDIKAAASDSTAQSATTAEAAASATAQAQDKQRITDLENKARTAEGRKNANAARELAAAKDELAELKALVLEMSTPEQKERIETSKLDKERKSFEAKVARFEVEQAIASETNPRRKAAMERLLTANKQIDIDTLELILGDEVASTATTTTAAVAATELPNVGGPQGAAQEAATRETKAQALIAKGDRTSLTQALSTMLGMRD